MNRILVCVVLDAVIALGASAALLQIAKAPLPDYYQTAKANKKYEAKKELPWTWGVTSGRSLFFGDKQGEVRLKIMTERELSLEQLSFFPSLMIKLKDGAFQVYFATSVPLRHEENSEVWITFSGSPEEERWVLEPAPTFRNLRVVEGEALLARLSKSQWVKIRFQPLRSYKVLETQLSLQPLPVALAKMERLQVGDVKE